MKKNFEKGNAILVIVLVSLISFMIGCSGGKEIQSSSNNNSITIDGLSDDWGTSINYVKDDNIAFGFKNDNDNLYIGIVTADRSKIMKMLTLGSTLWLEADKDKLGIRFPIKPDMEDMREMRMEQGGEETPEPGERVKHFITKQTDLQIINEDELPLYTDRASKGPDFIAKLGYENDALIYELKIPLTNNKFAERIFDNNTKEVKINFVTGKFDKSNFQGNNKEGNFGGMKPHNGNREGMGGNHPPKEKMNFDPLDYSFDVKLAK